MATDTTGINTNNINAMKNAIENWAKAVDAAKITLSAKQIQTAVKGTTQAGEIKKLCQACDSYANTLTAKLREYERRLDDVKTAYVKNDASAKEFTQTASAIKNLKS